MSDHDGVSSSSIDGGGLSYAQYVVASVVNIGSAVVSMMGSTSIVIMIIAAYRRRAFTANSKVTYQRLMLSVSISDFFFSAQIICQIFWIPSTKENAPWAMGTSTSCTALGATSIFLGTLVITYSGSLSLYFLLCIKYGWTEVTIQKWMERPVHLWAWGLATLLTVAGLVTNGYDVLPLTDACYFSAYERPAIYTNTTTNTTIILTSEERGFIPTPLSDFHVVYYLCSALLSCFMTCGVYCHVRQQLNRTRHTRLNIYPTSNATSGSGTPNSELDSGTAHTTNNSLHRTTNHSTTTTRSISRGISRGIGRRNITANTSRNNPVDEQIRNVAWQAVWYTAAYLNGFIWPFLRIILYESFGGGEVEGSLFHYTFYLLTQLFYPLQGALNFVVFIRPTYLKWRKYAPPEMGMRWILWQMYQGRDVPMNSGRSTRNITTIRRDLGTTTNDTYNTSNHTANTTINESSRRMAPTAMSSATDIVVSLSDESSEVRSIHDDGDDYEGFTENETPVVPLEIESGSTETVESDTEDERVQRRCLLSNRADHFDDVEEATETMGDHTVDAELPLIMAEEEEEGAFVDEDDELDESVPLRRETISKSDPGDNDRRRLGSLFQINRRRGSRRTSSSSQSDVRRLSSI